MKMKSFLPFILSCIILVGSACSNDLTIVKNNSSKYSVVLPEGADSLLQKSAAELQKYVEKTTGAVLPLIETSAQPLKHAILIGWPLGDETVDPDRMHISVQESNLTITGGSSKSVLYATYTFIETFLGVQFLTPDVEHIPTLAHLIVPATLHDDYTPAITTRTVHSRLFYQNPDFALKHKVTTEAFPGYAPGARVHTFHRFLPETEYYQKHPEYYALRNGKRVPTQLCLTNPKVFELVKAKVQELVEQHPESEVISVSQDDNTQYCQCDNCEAINQREESPAGSVIDFVNRIAQEFPDKQISTLAYQYTRKAPKNIKPASNVLITLCSIECDRSAPIRDKCSDFADDLIDWGNISDNIRIWDYTTQFTNFLAPFPNLHTLQPNIQLFRDNNAQWVFEQHSHHPSELFELRSFLTAKLLWQPDANQDSLVDTFLNAYYLEAAPLVKNYIERVHAEINKTPDFFLFLYGDPSQAFGSFLRPELLKQYDAWFNSAEQAVATTPHVLQRIRTARLSTDFAILEAARQQLSPDYSLLVTTDDKTEVSKAVVERLLRFENSCRQANITLMNEMGFGVDEYVALYQATLKRAQHPNMAYQKPVTLLTTPKKYANEDPQSITDGAFGGPSFYANWLGFEGHHLEAIIDLQEPATISEVSSAFLQVVNHLVFFPTQVSYYSSLDGKQFKHLATLKNERPLHKKSKINDIQSFTGRFPETNARYVKIKAQSLLTPPVWHHGTGLPSWIFVDEVQVR
jgi:hypothetical protein